MKVQSFGKAHLELRRDELSYNTRKPVFHVCHQVNLKIQTTQLQRQFKILQIWMHQV